MGFVSGVAGVLRWYMGVALMDGLIFSLFCFECVYFFSGGGCREGQG